MDRVNNLPHLLERRRALRKSMTYAEIILWKHVKGSKLGAKFTRQPSIGNFIIDFYCRELEIAIEVDGDTHLDEEVQQYDAWRQQQLEARGILVFRIPNTRFVHDGDQVAEEIKALVEKRREEHVKPKRASRKGQL